MKRLALVGLALAGAGLLAFSQQPGADPWWDPRNPNGQSYGVAYGTVHPTAAQDGLLAVVITSGSAPKLSIYDASIPMWQNLLASVALTDNYIPVYNLAADGLEDSTLTDDGTDLTATGGLFTVGAGNGLLNSITLIAGASSRISFEGAVDAHEVLIQPEDATVGDTLFVIEDQQGNTVYPVISVDAGTTDMEAANSIWMSNNTITFEGATADGFEGSIVAGDFLGGFNPSLTIALPVAGGSGSVLALATTIAAMDGAGGDVVDGFLIDITNADHAGGTFNGLRIDDITGDADATETAIHFGTGWDRHIYSDSSLLIDASAANSYYYTGTYSLNFSSGASSYAILQYPWAAYGTFLNVGNNLVVNAMNGSDTTIAIAADITNADHTGASNYLYGFSADDITEDPDAYESAAYFGSGYDAHLTLMERGGAYADVPPAGAIGIFVDDNADWSGGGGNDCALVAIDSTGATDVIAVLVLNGACP